MNWRRNTLVIVSLICLSSVLNARLTPLELADPVPDTPQCPRFTCQAIDNCTSGLYNSTEHRTNVLLSDPAVCKADEYCNTGGDAWEIYLQDTDDSKRLNGTCKPRASSTIEKNSRYPGEDCTSNDDCSVFSNTTAGRCGDDKKCAGVAFNQTCGGTQDCILGNFCNQTTKLCQTQLKDGDSCLTQYDCSNALTCNKGKCVKYYSLANGQPADDSEACQFGTIDTNGTCSQLTLTNVKDGQGFAKCNLTEKCNYSYNGQNMTTQKDCECGYNADGTGYCPLGHDKNTNQWTNLYGEVASGYDNGCHSVSRFACYITRDQFLSKVSQSSHDTVRAHLFYNAVSCALDVLSSSFINLSSLAIFIMLAFIF